MGFQHTLLAEGRWQQLSLIEQLANIGSEVHRAVEWKRREDADRFLGAFERALELFDLTLADPRWRHRLKEIARSREVFCDTMVGENQYGTPPEAIDKYFMQFGTAAAIERKRNREQTKHQ